MKPKTEKPKRKKNISPTHLTIKYLKERKIPSQVVEKWVKTPQGGFRKDCFGFDILSLPLDCALGIQAGADAHHSAKVKHALTHPDVKLWLQSPSRKFFVWTWGQRAAYNKGGDRRKKDRWVPRVTEIYMDAEKRLCWKPFPLASED